MLGVLIIPASPSVITSQVLAAVRSVNESLAGYAQIIDDMVVILPHDADVPRTSKGSILRPRAMTLFANLMDKTYKNFENGEAKEQLQSDDDVRGFIRQLVSDAVRLQSQEEAGIAMFDDEDLFNLGVNSLQAAYIRGMLQKVSGVAIAATRSYS